MGESGSGKLSVTTPSDRQIVMTRIFDAPRDLVFEAHTSCEHLRNWWGPRRYEIASCEVDFRPGGRWRIVHRGEGEEHGFRGEFREIVPPERIVWTFEYEGMPGHVSVETLTLEEHDGKTTLRATAASTTRLRTVTGRSSREWRPVPPRLTTGWTSTWRSSGQARRAEPNPPPRLGGSHERLEARVGRSNAPVDAPSMLSRWLSSRASSPPTSCPASSAQPSPGRMASVAT